VRTRRDVSMTLHLLDADVLIRAHEDYYPIDRIPQFWAWLVEMAEATAIKMPIQIYNEVAPSRGILADWLRRPDVKEDLVLLNLPIWLALSACSRAATLPTSPMSRSRRSGKIPF
jgi:hypothetical protein